MLKKMTIALLVISMLLNIGSITYGTTEVDLIIDSLNELRKTVGIVELGDNYELRNTALTHAKYMAYYKTLSITEESGNLYYRGRYTKDRAAYYNYEEPYVVEMIMKNGSSFSTNMNALIQNPYSRINLLDPKYQDIGVREHEDYFSFILGGDGRSTTKDITYPYDYQRNVPIKWFNTYRYSPYSSLSIAAGSYGLPITYSYYAKDDDVDNIIVNSISITTNNSAPKFTYEVLTPKEDKFLNNSIVIIPTETFRYSTTYKITLDLTVEFDRKNSVGVKKVFSFETEKDPTVEISSSFGNELLSRVNFTQELIKALDYTVLDPTSMVFKDVDINSIGGKYIYTAYYNNLIKGKSETIFSPETNITRQEAYTILVRAYEGKTGKSITFTNLNPINDFMNVSSWAVENNCIVKANAAGFLVTNSYNNLIGTGFLSGYEYDIIIKAFKESLDKALN